MFGLKRIGFDNAAYISRQSEQISKRISEFGGKLYLEFGGKLFDDYHASRVLPGFAPDSKLQMLKSIADNVEVVIVISAFDIEKNKMVKLPLYSPTEVIENNEIAYFLEFGYRFHDVKNIEPGKMVQIWECEVKERVKTNYGLENYLETNLPLILLKYPYPGSMNLATYEVNFLKFNYTGLNYNIDNIASIAHVDQKSPAAEAGIKRGL